MRANPVSSVQLVKKSSLIRVRTGGKAWAHREKPRFARAEVRWTVSLAGYDANGGGNMCDLCSRMTNLNGQRFWHAMNS